MRFVYFLALNCLYISIHAQPVTESSAVVNELIPGGLIDANVTDPDIKNATAFAVSEMDRRANSTSKVVLVRIISAKTQVVSGTVYYLQIEVAVSNSTKGEDASSLQDVSNNKVCDAQVWDRPWLNERELTTISCSPKTSRKKREQTLPEGFADADVSEEGVKNAADFALAEVDK